MPYFDPDETFDSAMATLAMLDRERLERARAEAAAMDRSTADRLSAMARHYGWMKPGVLLGLAQGGVDPGSSAAYNTALLSGATGAGLRMVGEEVAASSLIGRAWNSGVRSLMLAGEEVVSKATIRADIEAKYADALEAARDDEDEWRRLADEKTAAYRAAGVVETIVLDKDAPAYKQTDPVSQFFNQAEQVAVKPAARAAFMVLDAPLQEAQGLVRTAYGATHGEGWQFKSQSDLGIAVAAKLHGEEVDVGEGFFVNPQSRVAVERQWRERTYGQIGGQSVTLGRWVANQVVEPGSKPYGLLSGLVDLSVAIKADPTALTGGKAERVVAGRRLFTASDEARQGAGLLAGLRKTVHGPTAERWLMGDEGREVVRWLTETSSVYDIWRSLKRRVDPDVAVALADAGSEEAVQRILRPMLGTTFRSTADLPTHPYWHLSIAKRRDGIRLAHLMPANSIDPSDPMQAVTQTERILRAIRPKMRPLVPKADELDEWDGMVGDYVEMMARATSETERLGVLTELMGAGDGILAGWGIEKRRARSLTRLFGDTQSETRLFNVDRFGNQIDEPTVIDGELVEHHGPQLMTELIDRAIPLPDARELRRATSRFGTILSNPAIKVPLSMMHGFQEIFWKPAALVPRVSATLRVVGEEQFRMAAGGWDSMFAHPFSAVAYVLGRKGNVSVTGEVIDEIEEFRTAMSRGAGRLLDRSGTVTSRHWDLFSKQASDRDGYLGYIRGWADELAQLHADPVARQLAREGLDTVRVRFWDGDLAEVRQKLARGLFRKGQHEHPDLLTRHGAGAYLERVMARLSAKTTDHPDLIEAVATGRLAGADILTAGSTDLSAKFRDKLENYFEGGPEVVKGRATVQVPYGLQGVVSAKQFYDRQLDRLFGLFWSAPTNKMSRSPVFKQAYWERVKELADGGFLSAATRDGVLAQAVAAKMDDSTLAAIRGGADGTLTVDEVDGLAKGHGLDTVKTLLYDVTQRGQFFDITRLLFPFGEAWKEIGTRWAKLIREHPVTIPRRAQQIIEGARGEDAGELLGAPEGEGFFWTNQDGEEVFVIPGSQWVTNGLLGVPVPLVSRVQGLNLFSSSFLPGLGPVAQIPAGVLVPDTPEWREVKELLLPYGAPTEELIPTPSEAARAWTPAWLRRIFDSSGGSDPDSVRLYGNVVMDMARYLHSTGRYGNSREDTQKLMEDAKDKARAFYVIRGIAQNIAPSSPAPEFLVHTGDDRLLMVSTLVDAYRKMSEEDYRGAGYRFLEQYGDVAALVMQPKSVTVPYGLQATREADDWVGAHPDVKRDLPNIFGFFAPQGGHFDLAVYGAQLDRNERVPLTPEQWRREANDRMASIIYNRKRDEVDWANMWRPLNDEQRAWFRWLREKLADDYPGFGDRSGIPQKADPAELMREVEDALAIAAVRKTEVGQALAIYMRKRAEAAATAQASGLAGFQQAARARPLRDWLRMIGADLADKHADFVPLWEQILDAEMVDDTDLLETAA